MEPPRFSGGGGRPPQGVTHPSFVASPTGSMPPPPDPRGHLPGPGNPHQPYYSLPPPPYPGNMPYNGNYQGPWGGPYLAAGPHPHQPPAPWPGAPPAAPQGGIQLSSVFDGGREALEAARTWQQRAIAADTNAKSDLRSLLLPGAALSGKAYERALKTALVRDKEQEAARLGVEAAAFADQYWAPQLSGSLYRLSAGDLKRSMERGNVEGDWLLYPLPPDAHTAAAVAAAAAGGSGSPPVFVDQTPLRAKEIVEKLEMMMLEALQAKAEARTLAKQHNVPLALHESPVVAAGKAAAAAQQADGAGRTQEQRRLERQAREREEQLQQQRWREEREEREEMPPPHPRAPNAQKRPQQKHKSAHAPQQLQLKGNGGNRAAALRVEEEEEEEEEPVAVAARKKVGRPHKNKEKGQPLRNPALPPPETLLPRRRSKKRKYREEEGYDDEGVEEDEEEEGGEEEEDRVVKKQQQQQQQQQQQSPIKKKAKKLEREPLGPNGCWRSAMCPKEFGHVGKCIIRSPTSAPAAAAAPAARVPRAVPDTTDGEEKSPAEADRQPPRSVHAQMPSSGSKMPPAPPQPDDSQGDDDEEEEDEDDVDPTWAEQQATVERMRQARRFRSAGRQRKRQLPMALTPLGPVPLEEAPSLARRLEKVPLGPNGCWRSSDCDKEFGHRGWCNVKARGSPLEAPQGYEEDEEDDKDDVDLELQEEDGVDAAADEEEELRRSPPRSVTVQTVELTVEDDDGESE